MSYKMLGNTKEWKVKVACKLMMMENRKIRSEFRDNQMLCYVSKSMWRGRRKKKISSGKSMQTEVSFHMITATHISLMITVSLSLQKAGHLARLMLMICHASTFTTCFVFCFFFLTPSTNGHLVHSIAGVCGGGCTICTLRVVGSSSRAHVLTRISRQYRFKLQWRMRVITFSGGWSW